MSINLVIAITDGDWFDTLRLQPSLTEVNFWAPSAASFRALQPGELFLFKLHAPRNFIVGGGIFAYANTLPCSLVWEAFKEANGARSAEEMRTGLLAIAARTLATAATRLPHPNTTLLLRRERLDSGADDLVAQHRFLQDL